MRSRPLAAWVRRAKSKSVEIVSLVVIVPSKSRIKARLGEDMRVQICREYESTRAESRDKEARRVLDKLVGLIMETWKYGERRLFQNV